MLRVGLVAGITNGHLLFGLYGNFVGDINVGDDIISNCFPIFCFGQPLFHFSLQQSVWLVGFSLETIASGPAKPLGDSFFSIVDIQVV